jgi:hypothetical protein
VFALRLNRRKFAKNPSDWIRCKFSIDAGFPAKARIGGASTISKPYPASLETLRSPSASNGCSHDIRKPRELAVFDGWPARLSVRLISL